MTLTQKDLKDGGDGARPKILISKCAFFLFTKNPPKCFYKNLFLLLQNFE